MPGIYAVTSNPLVSLTRATLRRAEFGFLGVTVHTRVQTPRRCGQALSAGLLLLRTGTSRPLRTNWLIVGMDLRLQTKPPRKPGDRRVIVADCQGRCKCSMSVCQRHLLQK